MSDNNELSLLGEDLGDDDYDLGNEDEDALLADDYDVQREDYLSCEQDSIENQAEFQEYEEPLEDDVLDLGVTDGLDDLDSEIQESADDSSLSRKQLIIQEQSLKVKKEEIFESNADVDVKPIANVQGNLEADNSTAETTAHLESEEEEEGGEGEGRGRFKSERTNIVSLKSGKTYGNIPDSLDHVIPVDENNTQKQQHKRDGNQWRNRRGRGSGPRGGSRQHFHSKQQPPPHFQGPVFSPGPGPFVRHPLPPQQPPQQVQHHHHLQHQHQHQHQLQHQQPPMQQLPPPQPAPPPQPSHHPMQQPQQQQQQMPPQQMPPQQMQQPPHKILINPHFRGAVQPHPEARLIWDAEPPVQPSGDGLLPFPPRVFVEAPYAPGPPGNYEHTFQHHEPVVFHNSIPPQHQQIPHPQPPNQSYYPGEMYVEHPPSQPPVPQPLHPPHQAGPNVDYWHDVQPPHLPNQLQGPPHGRENFYPPPDAVFNPPQYAGPGPPEQSPFSVHMDHPGPVPGPPQGVFRLTNPPPGPGPGARFRQPPTRNFRNFTQQRPRFSGSLNGPHGRRLVGPVQHGPPQPQPSPPEPQPPQPQPPPLPQNFRSPQKRPSFDGPNNTVVPLTQGRFDPVPKRKKRMPDMSNLHEVQTVDTLPQHIKLEGQDENEDEETREYRKKIEEQKRLRERILQQKEARRKLAALEKQRELQRKDIDVQAGGDASSYFAAQNDPPQGNAIATIVNRNTVEPQVVTPVRVQTQPTQPVRGVAFQDNSVVNTVQVQATVPVVKQRGIRGRVVRGRGRGLGRGQANNIHPKQTPQSQPIQQKQLQHQLVTLQQQQLQQPLPQQQQPQQQSQNVQVVPVQGAATAIPGQRIVRSTLKPAAVQKTAQVPSASASKRVVLNQSSQRVVQVAPRTVMLRGANSNKLATNQLPQHQPQQPPPRRVVQAQQTRPSNTVPGRTVISNQNAGITVTAQAPDATSLPRTKLVAVENLAASTTDSQLRRMCQRVGIVENIQMIPAQRRAVITFSNPTSAITFLKRYQRKMVDLSLINVKLLT